MKKKNINIEYKEYLNKEELSKEEILLLERAAQAAESAYAPYSNFHVGAALLLSNGEIVAASNQENAAYPSGLCAERVAVFYAHAKYPAESILSMAVTAMVDGKLCKTPTYPCGACRQVLSESEKRAGSPIKIIIGGEKVIQIVEGISSLLPFAFDNVSK